MDVREAIYSRKTCRAFLDRRVSRQVVEGILTDASRAPSGGNLQPWRVWAVSGDDLSLLKATVTERIRKGEMGEIPAEHLIYPLTPKEPYESRKFAVGEAMYAAMGLARSDDAGRMRQLLANFEFFGAPVGLFFAIDRIMQPGQWAELGMYMQSVMLLARAQGLDTAPLGAWSLWHKTVHSLLGIPDDLILYCGMALGCADESALINSLQTSRAPLSEFAAFRGF
jgi:nitroreductase